MNYSAFLEDLGTRIKEIRLKQNMNEGEFADKLGLNREDVGKMEAGQLDLKITTLFKISNSMDVEMSELLAPGA